MPVTRESIIQHLYSTSVSAQPDATLELGEIAINAADEALFIKNASGTVKKLSATTDLTANFVTISTTQTVTGDKTFSGNVTFNTDIIFEGSTADGNETTLTVVNPTADQTITFPNATGTVGLVPGNTTEVVYNNAGALGSSSLFVYDSAANVLEVDGGHVRSDFLGAVQLEVRNTTGSTISAGTPVYATGYTGGRVLVAPADASDSAKMPAIGVLDAAIADSNNGHATVLGVLRNINTSSYSVNQTLYVASGGGLTGTRPTGASVLVQNMGRVVDVGANGEVVIFGPGRTNDVPNTVTVNGTIVFEGATADDFETTLAVADPTADRTITLPNDTGTVALVAGSDTQVMFNDGGSALGGDAGLTYNKTTDSLTITGDLAVNGSDITTSGSGTATVFNTNALTLNLGGAATAITMGDATTATTTVRGGTLVGNTTTQNLFNTTATTLNLGGAATAITMGDSTTATATIRGGTLVGNTTTQNLFNTTATTLNLGGAATALTMGATSGTTTTIRGGTLVGNTTTQNLFNTTATTLNIGGAATTVALGNTATAAQTVNMFTASTGASTYNFATGAPVGGVSKTLNIGNGGAAMSITNINIGTGSSGSVGVTLGSTGDGQVSVNSPICYLPGTVYVGGSLTVDNAIFGVPQTMFTDASITVYTTGPSAYLGGDNSAINVLIGDYEGWNDGTLITVDEGTDVITLNAGNGVTVNQDLAVNGGDITTTATGTATLFNTNATTLNLGGAATAITMGATSGTTTTIRGGTLVGNTTTQGVFNTTATTVNAFGAATTVNMGGASTNTVFAGTVEIDGTNALQFPDGTIQVTRTPDFLLFNLGII